LDERIEIMARITVPLDEAIRIVMANVKPGGIIKRIELTTYGPKLIVGFAPILRETGILIRFVKYEGSVAYFSLDGVPPFLNLNTILKLPRGITVTDSLLKVQPEVLISTFLKIRGVSVRNITWGNGTYTIDVSPNS
jgi:hypothetical protein